MSAQEECEQLRRQCVDPIQHDYEVIRPIVLFAETAAERSRQTGVERTVVGDKAVTSQIKQRCFGSWPLFVR